MSRPFLGYIGSPNFTTFNTTSYQGVATLDDISTLGKVTEPPVATSLAKPGGYGAFYNTVAVEYTIAQVGQGILIDGNASTNPDYAGAYKFVLGQGMTLEFHLWGAGGGEGAAGPGHSGYTKYVATFAEGTILGLYLPGWNGIPTTATAKQTAQWPDAGSGGSGANHGYSGGGSARLGPLYADLSELNDANATFYAIAGGGGGAHMYMGNPGAGGGASGTTAGSGSYGAGPGQGGSQTAGGTGGVASGYGGAGQNGSKYQGGNGVTSGGGSYGGGGGGGGGYFGGGAGGTVYAAGGGGSGYIDTSFSGYVSGVTTAGSTTASPLGIANKPTGAGDGGKRGAIFFKKV